MGVNGGQRTPSVGRRGGSASSLAIEPRAIPTPLSRELRRRVMPMLSTALPDSFSQCAFTPPILALNPEPPSFVYVHYICPARASLVQNNLVFSTRTHLCKLFFSVLAPAYKLM